MFSLSDADLQAYRAKTYRLQPSARLTNVDQALAFVEERGFITFWPIKGINLPSLWKAVAGDRPVASQHDDPGHITWGWKDEMLNQRRWYYGKLLRGKATLICLRILPYFYALSERVDELDDYRLAYEAGLLTREARMLADVLLSGGPQHTIQLKRLSHLSSRASKARFNKALEDLQRGLWVVPVGVARAGSWRYAHIYELFDRWFPETAERAKDISSLEARSCLAELYLDSVGAADPRDMRKVFGWKMDEIAETLSHLREAKKALPMGDGRWATTKAL